MKEILNWFLSRDNVTFVIAVAGFVLSLWNTLHDWFRNRKALIIEAKEVFSLSDPEGQTTEIVKFIATNKSKEPITLSGLSISCCEKSNEFGEYRLCLARQLNDKTEWHAMIFPIKIEGLGGELLFFASSGDRSVIRLNEPCTAEFRSNKGILKMQFVVSEFADQSFIQSSQYPG